MKAWKIPEDHKKKMAGLREENQAMADAWQRGWALIEELTGIKAQKRPFSGKFAFIPKDKNAALPEGLIWRKPRLKSERAMVVPDRRTKKGREMLAAWKEAGVQQRGIRDLDWFMRLFGPQAIFGRGGGVCFKTQTVDGEEYVIDGGALPLEEFGYEQVEISLSLAVGQA